jgi:WbqC-like protein family
MIGKLGIMQPYFLPHLGYFSLIKYSDEWVVFDTPQFIRHGWIERNRILKPREGWQYIKVPLEKHGREIPINEVRIRANEPWRALILAQIEHYKLTAPYYQVVSDLLREALSYETDSISRLNVHLLAKVCEYLGLPFRYRFFSGCNFELPQVKAPDEWALYISLALGAQEYVNPPGGQAFFHRKKYEDNKLRLTFLAANPRRYDQKRAAFEPGLSIVDVMMFNSISEIQQMLGDFSIS